MSIFYIVYISALAALSLIYIISQNSKVNSRIVYWLFAFPLVIYAAARPMDISRDDQGYLDIIKDRENYGDRDFAWHGLVDLLSDIGYGYRAVLVVTALFLFIKLYLIQKFLDRRIPALFLYAAVFWQLHDLTQIRLAWAMAFVIFFVLAQKGICLRNKIAIFAAATFHIQTLALLVSQFRLFRMSWRGLALFFGASYLIVQAGFFELINWYHVSQIIDQLVGASIGNIFYSYALLAEAKSGREQGYPVIIAASFIIFIYCFYRMRSCGEVWLRDVSNSIAFSIFFVCIFSALNDVMVRFHEMFLIYSLLLIGKSTDFRVSFALILLGVLYFIKFNVIWSLLGW